MKFEITFDIDPFDSRFQKGCRPVDHIEWFRPSWELPLEDSVVLAIVSGDKSGIHLRRAYELVVYSSDGEWYSDAYSKMENLEVHWWCELPDAPEEKI